VDPVRHQELKLKAEHDGRVEWIGPDVRPSVRIVKRVEIVRTVTRDVDVYLVEAECLWSRVH
jgi:hypothetical protein